MRMRSKERSGHGIAPRRTSGQRLRQRRRSGGAGVQFLSRISPGQAISLHQQKSPARHLGASGIALSREEHGLLRPGRVAWLTAFQPITVAGPRPIHTAFPASLACKLKFECMPRPLECQCRTENGTTEHGATEKTPPTFSDSSSWVCVFPLGRADLPESPLGGTVHSGKCSWNA